MQAGQTENRPLESPELNRMLTVSLSDWLGDKPGILQTAQATGKLLAIDIETDTGLEAFESDIENISMISIHFPDIMDGRGFSQAVQLRQTYRFKGTLRAVNTLADNIPFMQQCGFDSFVLENGELLEKSIGDADEKTLSAIEIAGQLGRTRFTGNRG